MDTWIMNGLLGISIIFIIFLSYLNWRILIVTEHIARTTGLFIQSLAEKSDLKENSENV